jgi:hypothetical protein
MKKGNLVNDKWADGITREEWTKRVESILDIRLRTKIASIVWWDHFCDAGNSEKTSLYGYVKKCRDDVEVPSEGVRKALIEIGYPVVVANMRVDRKKRRVVVDEEKPFDLTVFRPTGAEGLMYAVVVQAVEDMKYFIGHGIVIDKKVISGWPTKGSVGAIGYSNREAVEDLIKFFLDGDMERLVSGLGTNLKMEDVMKAIGLV